VGHVFKHRGYDKMHLLLHGEPTEQDQLKRLWHRWGDNMKTVDLKNMRRCKGPQIFQESGATLNSRCQKSDGVQNLVAWVTLHLGFVHCWEGVEYSHLV
jgi:hypothetical protein